MTQRQVFVLIFVVATGGFGCSHLTAMSLGFPIPFMMVTCSPGWILVLVLGLKWA